jgi:hypothetical protein
LVPADTAPQIDGIVVAAGHEIVAV